MKIEHTPTDGTILPENRKWFILDDSYKWIIWYEMTKLTVELYSLKFEIDFGVITDRGVFIEEILAEVNNKVNIAFIEGFGVRKSRR